jgi:amidohydrolase
MGRDDRPVIRDRVRELAREMSRFRRDLHKNPELGFQEKRTAEKIAQALRGDLADLQTGIAKTGVSGLLRSEQAPGRGTAPGQDVDTGQVPERRPPAGGAARAPERAILLRADMDALPIQEESGAEYASQNDGVMHACGHDGHTSILLHSIKAAVAEKKAFGGTIRFVFQPAEESPGGALPMIQEGILRDPPVEAAFGLHLWTQMPTGQVAVTAGPMMAAADEFRIVIHGKGGHGALPHQTVDAVTIGSHLVVALQTLVARNTDPMQTAVVSVGSFHAGDTFNIIAETASMKGTLRTFDKDVRDLLVRRLREVSEGVCTTHGARCEFTFVDHYPPTVNDPRMADFVAEIAAEVVGEENVLRDVRIMGGEDMSYFLQEVPGAFFFVGAGNEAKGMKFPHHNPHFDFDEDAMPIGTEIFLRIMERYWECFAEPPGAVDGANR